MKRNNRQAARKPPSFPTGGMPRPHPAQADAIEHLRAGRFGDAAAILRQIIASEPKNWQCLHLLGLTAYKQRNFEEAAAFIRRCLDVRPDLAEAYSDLGVVLKDLEQFDDASKACAAAIALKPNFHPAYSNLGNVLKAAGRFEDAATAYRKAIALAPNFAEAHANLGTILVMLGRAEEALAPCQKAVSLAPDIAELQVALGHALRQNRRIEEALAAYRTAIELKPAFAPAYTDLGSLLQETGQFDAAIRAQEQALMLQPDFPEAHNNIGVTLKNLGRYGEASEHYRKAVALKPSYADAYSNLGVVLDLMDEHAEAVAAYNQAMELAPRSIQPYLNLAGSLWGRNALAEATAIYAKALEIDPNHPNALTEHYNLRRYACDWKDLAATEERILRHTYAQGKRIPPFALLNVACGPQEHLLCARTWVKGLPRPVEKPFTYAPLRSGSGNGRLRIGYLSADYYQHATASLITELLECHDRSRFETVGYCFSRDDNSGVRQRIIAAFDRFEVIATLSHADAARRINAGQIDILVDLKGYTTGARTEILACRPAPIQVNYLGYPGTMGADFIDYIIADPFILPMDQASFFDEKIVRLPGCYQPNGTMRAIASEVPSRAGCGLPEDGFVFCCFNDNYKITPQVFGLWMRLLQAVPGSVLWLLQSNDQARGNLCREAAAHGVEPSRLVFAPRAILPEHLARHRLADMFLDTAPVNAHTTASDALWAGLPVLTCAGNSFVSRVCGSLLHAIGLPELVTHTPEDYEAVALRLARDPAALARLRDRLGRNRLTSPLFDIGQYRRGLEAAYEHMADLHAAGHSPRAFATADTGKEQSAANAEIAPASIQRRPLPELDKIDAQAPVYSPRSDKHRGTASIQRRPLPELDKIDAQAPASIPAKARPEPRKPSVRIAYEACPLCGATDIAPHKEADCSQLPCYNAILPPVMVWMRCGTCGHIFTEGYLTPEAAAVIFSKTIPHQCAGHDVEAQRVASARIVERVAPHAPKLEAGARAGHEASLEPGGDGRFSCGDWLDVGFGNASLVFTAEEWGFRTVGLDLRKANVEALANLGYEAYCTPIEELDFTSRFAVISMADVLEHMPYPATALKAAHRLLRPRGALFLSMPNMDTIIWRILDTSGNNPYWGEIEHYHNFSRARLYALLEEHGFSAVSYGISERYRACMEVVAVKV